MRVLTEALLSGLALISPQSFSARDETYCRCLITPELEAIKKKLRFRAKETAGICTFHKISDGGGAPDFRSHTCNLIPGRRGVWKLRRNGRFFRRYVHCRERTLHNLRSHSRAASIKFSTPTT